MKGFVEKMILEVKKGEKKGRVNTGNGQGGGGMEDPAEEVAIENVDGVIAA